MNMMNVSAAKRQSRVIAAKVLGPIVRHVNVNRWPGSLAWLYRMNVPKNVRRNESLSPNGGSNINIIFDLFYRVVDVPGEIAECGVYRGSSALTLGLHLKQNQIPKKIFGFDSFEGFGESVKIDQKLGGEVAWGKNVGGYGDTSYGELLSRIKSLGLDSNLEIVKGPFEKTFSLDKNKSYCFVHLDCDLYQSYKYGLEHFYPLLSKGGILLLDEYNDPPWPGCNKAVDEFLANVPEKLQQVQSDNQIKFYIRKL